jgi:tyrosinase
MPRSSTYSTRTQLGYSYQNEAFPSRLPLALQRALPPVGTFRQSPPRQTSEQTFALGGALEVGLDERPVSVQLPVSSENTQTLARIATGSAASLPGSSKLYRSIHLVLDGIEITETGKGGGYYYQIYLNIPVADGVTKEPGAILIGTLGPFKISGAAHHGGPVQLRYRIERAAFAGVSSRDSVMSVSFVRVNGDQSPSGSVIGLGEVRLETSTEDEDA